MSATPQRLLALRDANVLSEDAYERAIAIAAEPPPPDAQASFASRAALILGSLLCLAGVVFFVAHNWDGLSRWAKFGVLELGLVAFAAGAWVAKGQLTRQLALSLCAAMLGPLLAVYGQTYQTGADPYELFFSWVLLAAPIAALARFMPLWAGVWFLLDVTAGLWCDQLRPFGEWAWHYQGFVIAAVNFLGLGLYELVSRRTKWLGEPKKWPARALAVAALLPALPDACWYLSGDRWWRSHNGWDLSCCMLVATLCLALAVAYRRDRFMRSTAAFGVCGLVTSEAGRLLRDGLEHERAWWLLLGLIVVVEITLVAAWVRRTPAPREVTS